MGNHFSFKNLFFKVTRYKNFYFICMVPTYFFIVITTGTLPVLIAYYLLQRTGPERCAWLPAGQLAPVCPLSGPPGLSAHH